MLLKRDETFFSALIRNADLYFAHKPATGQSLDREPLTKHAALVMDYFYELVLKNQLEPLIDQMIREAVPSWFSNRDKMVAFIKQLFVDSAAYHDFGKVNHLFQNEKMDNHHPGVRKIKHSIKSKHSILSAYIFILHKCQEANGLQFSGEEETYVDAIILYFSYPIIKHHSSTLGDLRKGIRLEDKMQEMKAFLGLFTLAIASDVIDCTHRCVLGNIDNVFKQLDEELELSGKEYYQEFPLFALLKLNFSLLTASDYLATMHYMNSWSKMYDEFGLLGAERKTEIAGHIRTFEYNRNIYNGIDGKETGHLERANLSGIDRLRSEMAVEVINNIKCSTDKHLFYIEAPTGGGKTNLSLIALAELFEADSRKGGDTINKVVYVFPFTTLITQTYAALMATCGLDASEIIELHAKAGFKQNDIEEDEDGCYGNDNVCYIDNLMINYPFVVTSHVKFFDILTTERKEKNYPLHRFANSVVIIDELQSYSPKLWDKLIYFIDNYARYFNIKFILMSATLPKIGNLVWEGKQSDFNYLITDKNKYQEDSCFKNRVTFDLSLLKWPRPDKSSKQAYLRKLSEKVFETSKEYKEVTGRVFTIIEFIFKQTASDFFNLANENDELFFDHIFVLSGTILEPRRKEIIAFLKDKSNKNKSVLLITTQVVEAGVDIDMDLGFKDRSLIDSEEQFAGRVNRNAKKKNCVVYLFDCDLEHFIYGNDKRHEIVKELDQSQYEEILNGRAFDIVYEQVIADRVKHNLGSMNIGLNDYRQLVNSLNFTSIDKGLTLIEGRNYSVFVAIDIPISIPETDTMNFTKEELVFLTENGRYEECSGHVCGTMVWELYEESIKTRDNDFIGQKIKMKRLQGLMSKFTFSLLDKSKDAQRLIARGYKDFDTGFIYLDPIDSDGEVVYSYLSGLATSNLDDAMIF